MKKYLSLTMFLNLLLSYEAFALFGSGIFSYDDQINAKKIHVSLTGEHWSAREVQEGDIPFFQNLFGNETVMKNFGNGPLAPEMIENRLRNVWIPRFANGQPHGGLTVLDSKNDKIGHVVVGGGEGPGGAEMAYSYIPESWGKGIGSSVATKVISDWAPEVRRIGLGKNLDEIQDKKIIDSFNCFGGKPLERIDATASPNNPRSWKILTKLGFEAAKLRVTNQDFVVNLEQKEIKQDEVETNLLKLFDVNATNPLQVGIRYRMIDPKGDEGTFSKHGQYDCIKYHFEFQVK